MRDTFEYCRKNGLLGVGWQLDSPRMPVSWDDYVVEASALHGKLDVCKYIKRYVAEGDLVWTRDTQGMYYLAKVVSGWEYWISPEAVEKDIDIANIFRVVLYPVELDSVPGKVVACFRPSRSIQEIQNKSAVEYSKYLWNVLSGTNDYAIDVNFASNMFDMLDDEETEDLLFMYLQRQGWYIVPNSRKKDTMSYEFLAVNPRTGERAISQVKTGHTSLCRDDYARYPQHVFLFQSNDEYSGSACSNVTCLSTESMKEFMQESRAWLPLTIQRKLTLCESIGGK